MTATTVIIYILLLLSFFVISGLILRHTVKFRYLSNRFTYVVGIFALIAFVTLIFTLYLMFQVDNNASSTTTTSTITTSNDSDLNF